VVRRSAGVKAPRLVIYAGSNDVGITSDSSPIR